MHHGFDVVEVKGLDIGGVVEHGGELVGEALKIRTGKVEAGKAGHVGHVVRGDALGHSGAW